MYDFGTAVTYGEVKGMLISVTWNPQV